MTTERNDWNTALAELPPNYLFSEVAARVRAFRETHPERTLVSLSVGDVTRPLGRTVVTAMHRAAEEMSEAATFRGYAPEQGYAFLREAIASYVAREQDAHIDVGDVFVSDGAKSDAAHLCALLGDADVYVPDPGYPVYADSARIAGKRVRRLCGTAENGFLPMPPDEDVRGVFWLCSPSNPSGAAYSRAQLEAWVAFAVRSGSLLLFDGAYEAFVTDPAVPRSIYAIPGAETCAIEVGSLSKSAGFTGVRCGWTVVPKSLAGGVPRALWMRYQATTFNGVSYVTQRAAEAALSEAGVRESRAQIAYYRENARILSDVLRWRGIAFVGGEQSPYLFVRCPDGFDSWAWFAHLLAEYGMISTPGVGFGAGGEGYVRFSAFAARAEIEEAARRILMMEEKHAGL